MCWVPLQPPCLCFPPESSLQTFQGMFCVILGKRGKSTWLVASSSQHPGQSVGGRRISSFLSLVSGTEIFRKTEICCTGLCRGMTEMINGLSAWSEERLQQWIEISCFIEGASKREGSLGIGATAAWPGTWVDPPCWHRTAQPSARLAARGRLAHPPLKSLRPKERKIEESSSCWFAKM